MLGSPSIGICVIHLGFCPVSAISLRLTTVRPARKHLQFSIRDKMAHSNISFQGHFFFFFFLLALLLTDRKSRLPKINYSDWQFGILIWFKILFMPNCHIDFEICLKLFSAVLNVRYCTTFKSSTSLT